MQKAIMTHSLSAGGTIRRVVNANGMKESVIVLNCLDDYSHGPLDYSNDLELFFKSRDAFWQTVIPSDITRRQSMDLLNQHQQNMRALRVADRIEIWASSTIQDQLFIAAQLWLAERESIDLSKVRILQTRNNEARFGLGAVPAEEMAQLFLERPNNAPPVDPSYYLRAWQAVLSGTHEVAAFVDESVSDSPITPALRAYLLRFPDFNKGLGSLHRRLLTAGTTQMKAAAYTVGGAMAFGQPNLDIVSEWVLFKSLIDLAHSNDSPWFEIEGDCRDMRSCSAKLTKSGELAREKFVVTPF